MSAEKLLEAIRRAIDVQRTPEKLARRLDALVNAPGAAEALALVVRSGEIGDAQFAALALTHARSELVRRGIVRDVRAARSARRGLMLTALTEEEMALLASQGVLGEEELLIDSLGPYAVGDPALFVDFICRGTAGVSLRLVEHIERIRKAYAIPTTSLHGALLRRRLTKEARRKVLEVLAQETSSAATELLERELERATKDDEQRMIRRALMKQRSRLIEGGVWREQAGIARLSSVGPKGVVYLFIVQSVSEGRCVETMVRIGARTSAASIAVGVELEEHRDHRKVNEVEISLGQAKALLGSLSLAKRRPLEGVFERLEKVEPEPLQRPRPVGRLTSAEAQELVEGPACSAWTLSSEKRSLDEALLQPAFRARLAAGLQHTALWLSHAGHPGAGAVAAEALEVTKRRSGALSRALWAVFESTR